LNLGPDRFEEAERVLGIVLADSVMVTPRAPEFCDALFLRGEIALSRGEPERAIATLEEAIDRYPRDPRVWPSRFTIADAYRRSSAELRRELSRGDFAGDRDVTGAESLARMRKARDLYRIVIDEYEMRSLESLNRLELLFLRHARLYEADCQFETRDFQTAIKLYEQVAGTMKDSAHALAAFVQIINCHVFLGQAADAHAALARARVLADALPAEVFQTHGSPQTRQDWKNYLEWLEESELF